MNYSVGHTRYINKDNIEVPSVTTVLKMLNKPALQKWANFLGFKRQKVDDVLAISSSLGSQFHDAVESFLIGEYLVPCCNDDEEEYKLKLYISTFISWHKTNPIVPIFMERRFTNSRFGGTVDFYGMCDGKKTIIDFKTSKAHYSSMFLQLAAYTIMIEEAGHEVEQVGIICCNTKVITKFMTREEIEPYVEVFRLLIEFFHKWYDLNIVDKWGKII